MRQMAVKPAGRSRCHWPDRKDGGCPRRRTTQTARSSTCSGKGGSMNKQQADGLTLIEGRQVSVALRNGSRIDDCQLVSGGRKQVASLWLFSNGEDVFVAR